MQANPKPITSIQPYHFYKDDSEKTNFNWFAFELACEIDKAIPAEMRKYLKKKGYAESDYYASCIKLAKLLQGVVLRKLQGKTAKMEISYRPVEQAFPKLNQTTVNRLLDCVNTAWDHLTGVCVTCPQACVSNKDEYCDMFDDECYYDDPDMVSSNPNARQVSALKELMEILGARRNNPS